MSFTWTFIQTVVPTLANVEAMIDVVGQCEGMVFRILDMVVLVHVPASATSATMDLSVLDGFLIGGFVFELMWEIIDDLRA